MCTLFPNLVSQQQIVWSFVENQSNERSYVYLFFFSVLFCLHFDVENSDAFTLATEFFRSSVPSIHPSIYIFHVVASSFFSFCFGIFYFILILHTRTVRCHYHLTSFSSSFFFLRVLKRFENYFASAYGVRFPIVYVCIFWREKVDVKHTNGRLWLVQLRRTVKNASKYTKYLEVFFSTATLSLHPVFRFLLFHRSWFVRT